MYSENRHDSPRRSAPSMGPPSAAPAFAKLPSMAIYFKIAPSLRDFEAAHSGSNRVYDFKLITVKKIKT